MKKTRRPTPTPIDDRPWNIRLADRLDADREARRAALHLVDPPAEDEDGGTEQGPPARGSRP